MIQFINESLFTTEISKKADDLFEYTLDVAEALRVPPKDDKKTFPFVKIRANSEEYNETSDVSYRAVKKPDGKVRVNLRFIDNTDDSKKKPEPANLLLVALPYYGIVGSLDTSKFHVISSRFTRVPQDGDPVQVGDRKYRKVLYLAMIVDTDENGIADTEIITYSNTRNGKEIDPNSLSKTVYNLHYDKNSNEGTVISWDTTLVDVSEFDMTARVTPFERWVPEKVYDPATAKQNNRSRNNNERNNKGSFYASDNNYNSQKAKRDNRRKNNKIYK